VIPGASNVEILAGTPAGGGQDRAARALAAALAAAGEPTPAVVNIPGRGGGNAWDELTGRRGDSMVVAISSPTLITNELLGAADIDERDLTPLANLYTEYIAFGVPGGSAIRDAEELAARLVGAAPLRVAFATALGNINHMAIARVVRHGAGDPAALELRVFDSARLAVADVLAGHADVVAVSAPSVLPEVAAGTLVILAVSSPERLHGALEAVPTWSEVGVPCVIGTWRGVVGTGGLDADAIAAWDAKLRTAVSSSAWRAALSAHSWSDTYLPSTETTTFLATQRREIADALRDLGLQP
jgi:putative tricarboxylic transport membrane protein